LEKEEKVEPWIEAKEYNGRRRRKRSEWRSGGGEAMEGRESVVGAVENDIQS